MQILLILITHQKHAILAVSFDASSDVKSAAMLIIMGTAALLAAQM